MPFDLSLVGQTTEPKEFTYEWRDVVLYALGVGAKREELDYLYEGRGPHVLPSFAVVPMFGPMFDLLQKTGGDLSMIVHHGQKVRVHAPLPPSGTVRTTATLRGIYDMRKLAVVRVDTETKDASGALLADTSVSMIFRGAGGFGGESPPKEEKVAEIPKDRAPDFVVEEAALGSDEERDRPRDLMGTRRRSARMRDEAPPPDEPRRQDLLDQHVEAPNELDLREDGVARLLEAEQQTLADRVGGDVVALPEALLGPRGGDDEDPLDAEAGRRREQTPEDGHPGERQDQLDRPLRRGIRVEGELELECLLVEGEDPPLPHPPPDETDPEPVPDLGAQDLPGVPAAAAGETRAARRRIPLVRLEQQAVQSPAPRLTDPRRPLLESDACRTPTSSKPAPKR